MNYFYSDHEFYQNFNPEKKKKLIEITSFGLMVRIFCSNQINMKLNQIIKKKNSSPNFVDISQEISDLLVRYPSVYSSWLPILGREVTHRSESYDVVYQIAETFIENDEHKTAMPNYLLIIIKNAKRKVSKAKLLNDLLQLHNTYKLKIKPFIFLDLALRLFPLIPIRPKNPHNFAMNFKVDDLVNSLYPNPYHKKYKLPDSIDSLEKEFGDIVPPNLDELPQIDHSYLQLDNIEACDGFPLYVTNIIGKCYSVGSEGDNTLVEFDAHQLYSSVLQVLFTKFEQVVICDDHLDAFLSNGNQSGIRQRILFKDLYGDSWERYIRIMEEGFTSQIISNHCKNNIQRVLKAQYMATRDLEALLRHIPKFDIANHRQFSNMESIFTVEARFSLSCCSILESILNNFPSINWFLSKVLTATGFFEFNQKLSIDIICGNAFANAVFYYCQCIILMHKFLHFPKFNSSLIQSVDKKYFNYSCISSNVKNETEINKYFDNPYSDTFPEDGKTNTIFGKLFENGSNLPHYSLSIPTTNNQIDKLVLYNNEDRYVSSIENTVFFLVKKYLQPSKNMNLSFIQKFIHDFTHYDISEKYLDEAEDRFGCNTKYFLLFCYNVKRLSSISRTLQISNEWNTMKKLFLKYGKSYKLSDDFHSQNFPHYLFKARANMPFPLVKIEYNSESGYVKFIPLG